MSDCRPIVYTTLPQHNRLAAEHTAGEVSTQYCGDRSALNLVDLAQLDLCPRWLHCQLAACNFCSSLIEAQKRSGWSELTRCRRCITSTMVLLVR